VAVIGSEGEAVEPFLSGTGTAPDATIPRTEEAVEKASPEPEHLPAEKGRADTVSGGRIAISPRAKKLAEQKRISYTMVQGTGPGGRIIERDIQAEIEKGKRLTPLAQKKLEAERLSLPHQGKAPFGKITSHDLVQQPEGQTAPGGSTSSGAYREVPLTNVRKIIAAAMYRSLQQSAQLTHHLSANAAPMLSIRREVKKRMTEGYPANITINDMVCFAVIRALKEFPEANAHFSGEVVRQFEKVNLGIAVDTDRGLLVPALLQADDLSLPGLSGRLGQLAEEARSGKVSPDLLAPEAASFTVSNLGNYGVEMFTPVINLPQVAILGVNTIVQRPATLKDGTFGFLPFIGLSLTYDHRALDGGPATRFLAAIKTQIENLSTDLL
jgi:pyruvate dehydrogenase E2 component (dihydrolipoamide acetyltransferase)